MPEPIKDSIDECVMWEIELYIKDHGYENTIKWIKEIGELVNHKSGMFGITFDVLIPYVESLGIS